MDKESLISIYELAMQGERAGSPAEGLEMVSASIFALACAVGEIGSILDQAFTERAAWRKAEKETK